MLISFTLENYRSFKDRHKIICIPRNKLKKYPNNIQNNKQCNYLKVISLYGANASGKSNIIKALRSMYDLLCYEKEFDKVLAKAYEPFAYDESMKKKPTFFEVELLLDNKIVKYNIQFDRNKIYSENLEEYVDDKYIKILSYSDHNFYYDIKYSDYTSSLIKDLKTNKNSQNDNDKQQSALLKLLTSDNNESISQLKTVLKIPDDVDVKGIIQNFTISFSIRPIVKKSVLKFRGLINVEDKIAINIQKWFIDKLIILDIEFDNIAKVMMMLEESYGEVLLDDQNKKEQLNLDKNLKKRINRFISDADLSIKYVYSKKNESGHLLYNFFSQHNIIKEDGSIGTTSMDFFQSESVGTQRLLAFSYHIMETIDNGGLLLVDELDRSFHPLLVSYIISYFNSPDTNPKGGQLIFTTHASELLRISKLRLDQILFVSKDGMEHSDIYPLYKYKSESDDEQQYNLADEYLFGRFGGIPILPSGHNFGE